MGKKRELSVFGTIEELETQDRRADGKRHRQQQVDQQRAQQVEQQTKIYHHLVESRILLQRAIKNNNDTNPGSNETVTDATVSSVSKFRDICNALLEQLLVTRSQLSGFGNPKEQDPNYYKDILRSSHSSSLLSESLQAEYEQHREQWKHILNQRHKSLRLHSGVTAKSTQFRVMDASFWQQVEATVEYETTRSSSNNGHSVVEDAKVYQHLLKEFVSSHAMQTGTDAAKAAAERLRLAQRKSQKERRLQLKSVMVDRRASKLRIKEIPKLVNFAFPLSRPASTSLNNLNQDEYFRSLFGGSATATATKKSSKKVTSQ
jgi:hypothetical protein